MDIPTLLAARTRGEVRRLGAWLDGPGRDLRAELVVAARESGATIPDDWPTLPGKRLLRACLDRAGPAEIRRNPIARDEAFTCVVCGRAVPVGGRRPRDHCPACLHSVHVDVVPGDRSADCGGVLVPVRIESRAMIVYRCQDCGALRRNRVLDDLDPPDDPARVARLLVDPREPG